MLGPTVMILIGLTILGSVPLTFVLFYGWLLLVPMISNKGLHRSGIIMVNTNKRKSIIIGLVSGVAFGVLILGAVRLLIEFIFDLTHLQQLLVEWGFTGKGLIGLILILIVVNPVLEELYWREFMFKRLHVNLGTALSIIISSVGYSLYHFLSLIPMFNWPLNVISVLPVFLVGIIWGFFRARLKSILAPILSHILADAGIMLVFIFYIIP
jgi:membrane protease YdiL (CAAX protease family)